jgi:hypothetical protein
VGDGFALVAPFGEGWYRVFAWNRNNQVEDSAPLDLAEVREVTRRALGSDFGMHDPRWLSRFHSDERQVPAYRVGRVFLAGDAAHCHSPAGGQGMNTGMQDAANLGWKLAAAVAGWGGEALLDSYHAERHPVGRQVLRSSGLLVRLALVRPWWARMARNTIAPAIVRLPIVRTGSPERSPRSGCAIPHRPGLTIGLAPGHPTSSSGTGGGSTKRCAAGDSSWWVHRPSSSISRRRLTGRTQPNRCSRATGCCSSVRTDTWAGSVLLPISPHGPAGTSRTGGNHLRVPVLNVDTTSGLQD